MNFYTMNKCQALATEMILKDDTSVFDMLGISQEDYQVDDVKRQFRKVALLIHPDKNGHTNSSKAFVKLSDATEKLLEQLNSSVMHDTSRESINSIISLKSHNGTIKSIVSKKQRRPRGRAPKGKVWDEVRGWVKCTTFERRPRGRAPKGKKWVNGKGWQPV